MSHSHYGHKLVSSSTNGISWVIAFDSKIPGPTIVITACTHGWETAGIEAMEILDHEIHISTALKRGKLYFILANKDAYQKLLETGDIVNSRYVDENMNRCCSIESLRYPVNSERKRVNELLPILSSADIHLDIHSTYTPSESMAIYYEKGIHQKQYPLNMDKELMGLPERVTGEPLISIIERNWGTGLAMETGDARDGTGKTIALDNILRILCAYNMIELHKEHLLPEKSSQKIHIYATILVENASFLPTREYIHGESVPQGTLIATQNDREYTAVRDSIILMPAPVRTNMSTFIGEEYCFLGEKIASDTGLDFPQFWSNSSSC